MYECESIATQSQHFTREVVLAIRIRKKMHQLSVKNEFSVRVIWHWFIIVLIFKDHKIRFINIS